MKQSNTIGDHDMGYMAYALRLADTVKGTTFPNPAVGAVIVRGTNIVGTGATSVCGGPHAETNALKEAGHKAADATMYVTLEPCNHCGRTPPCTDAIIAAGIKTVYVAVRDPNPLVSGRGIRRLRAAGITVHCGLLREEAALMNEEFFWFVTHKKPWITLKLALTLDGRIADESGTSQWITSPASRTIVHDLRRRYAAIAVGRTTLEKDDPHLTVRHVTGNNPVRIIFSSNARVPGASYFVTSASTVKSIIVVRSLRRQQKLVSKNGPAVWYTGSNTYKGCLHAFMDMAYEEGLTSILIEGGQKLASSFLEQGLVNRLYLFYGNAIVGNGIDGLLFSEGLPLGKALSLSSQNVTTVGNDILVTGIPQWK